MKGLRVATGLFLAAAAGTAVVAVAAGWESWEALRRDAAAFRWETDALALTGALVAGIAALLVTARLWADLFARAGGQAEPAEAALAWLGSNLGRYLPGKVWQLTGITAYFRARGDSGAAGFATSLALQAVIVVTGLGLGLALAGGVVDTGLPAGWAIAGGAVLLMALHPRVLGAAVRTGARLLGEPPPEGRLEGRHLLRAGGLATGVWLLYGLGLQALVAGVVPGAPLGTLTATGVFAAAYVVGYLAIFAPGGLVVREGALALLLVGTTGIPPGAAAAVAAVARLWTTAAELAAFGIAALGLRMSRGGR